MKQIFAIVACLVAFVACVAQAKIQIKEVVVFHGNTTEISEDVTFDDVKEKTDQKKVVSINFRGLFGRNRTTTSATRNTHTKRRHFALRRKCCQAGDKAGKRGLSCNVTRNYRNDFFNLTTRTQQKFQGSGRFKDRRIRRLYHEIKRCVRHHQKSIVKKCCVAYTRKNRQGY